MEWWILAILVAVAFLAAFIDSIVGGGGVISLPALLAAGFPPHLALGTNKVASTGASFMATIRYTQAGLIVLPLALLLIPFAAVGSFVGAATVLRFEAQFVRALVIAVMILMTLYVLLRKQFGQENRFVMRAGRLAAAAGVTFVIGFYDGFLGPGAGSLFLFMLLGVSRLDFLRAAGHGRILNFASNLAALVLFALRGHVDFLVGLPMMASMMAGAYVGSHFGIRHGTRWIKPLFVTMTTVILVRLLLF